MLRETWTKKSVWNNKNEGDIQGTTWVKVGSWKGRQLFKTITTRNNYSSDSRGIFFTCDCDCLYVVSQKVHAWFFFRYLQLTVQACRAGLSCYVAWFTSRHKLLFFFGVHVTISRWNTWSCSESFMNDSSCVFTSLPPAEPVLFHVSLVTPYELSLCAKLISCV